MAASQDLDPIELSKWTHDAWDEMEQLKQDLDCTSSMRLYMLYVKYVSHTCVMS